MDQKVKEFLKKYEKANLPEVKAGDLVRVYFKSKGEGGKTHVFEGIVIARKHGKEIGATMTVRKEIGGIGVERIFPLHSPLLEKIEIIKRQKTRRSKLYYLRKKK
ncbi:50S ribosomal protein L19 [Candidatus Parcubacteria bacterium]|nr:50S ribosomal protein L19 [Candidatus Parcubacteria bacterium]